jgi:hypothetical protein
MHKVHQAIPVGIDVVTTNAGDWHKFRYSMRDHPGLDTALSIAVFAGCPVWVSVSANVPLPHSALIFVHASMRGLGVELDCEEYRRGKELKIYCLTQFALFIFHTRSCDLDTSFVKDRL